GGLVADVPVHVRVDEVLARHLPALERRAELRPALRAIEGEPGEVARRARLAARPAKGPRETPAPVFVDDRAVAREAQLHPLRRTALDPDRLGLDAHALPAVAHAIPARVIRVELLGHEVLGVYVEDRQAPRDALVVADRDAR